MTSKINFENFKNGDKVIITISDKNEEEIYPCKIIDIVPTKKLIHFEDNESEYECKFSEVKSIVRMKKIRDYNRWITLYIVSLILVIVLDYFFSFPKPNEYAVYSILSGLILLDIWQYIRVKMDKLNIYEKQNNIPYTLNISSCVLICPALITLMLFVASVGLYISPLLRLVFLLLSFSLGLILFIRDQVELYQHRENYPSRKKFWIRMIEFLIFYPFFIFVSYAFLMIFTSG